MQKNNQVFTNDYLTDWDSDEKIFTTNPPKGEVLKIALLSTCPFRQLYFFIETNDVGTADFFVKGQFVFRKGGTVLGKPMPASFGLDAGSALPKSIVSVPLAAQAVTPDCIRLTLGSKFAADIVVLLPTNLVIDASEVSYEVLEYSANVTALRVFLLLKSANAPLW